MLKRPTYFGSLNPIALNADEQAMYWNKARRSNCNFQTMASSSYFNPRLKLNHWPLLKWENPNMITYFMTGAWSASSRWSRMTKMSCDHIITHLLPSDILSSFLSLSLSFDASTSSSLSSFHRRSLSFRGIIFWLEFFNFSLTATAWIARC